MEQDLKQARTLLDTGDYTCVVCKGEQCYTTQERGVKPLVTWLEADCHLTGFSAADRVVGRATAFLYCLLGVSQVYARVMSRPAAQVLEECGIGWQAGELVDGIINRRGTGPCPFESAVLDISSPQEALAAILKKMEQMGIR